MKNSRVIKNIIAIVLIAAFIIPGFGSVDVKAASYKTGIYEINTQSTPLNVRSYFGSEYMKVGEIAKGKKVHVTFVSSNGWGKVTYGDVHGWISLEYCKYIGEYEENESEASSLDNVSYGISTDNLLWVTGWKQEFSKSSGLCTSSATTSLLRRRQAAEGKEVTFNFGDIRAALGGNPIPDANGKYESCNSYFSSTTPFVHLTSEGTKSEASIAASEDETEDEAEPVEPEVYYLIKETVGTHAKNREYLADLLDVHPEGVVTYATYPKNGRHAILISDYERKSDGSLQFYAYDPANGNGRCKLEETWMMKKVGSVGAFFSNMISIWYVQGELKVDDGYFTHPEAQVFNRSVTVKKKKTGAYAEADMSAEPLVTFAKGDVLNVCYMLTGEDGTEWYITDDELYIEASRVQVE